ncbi:hypothetical protein TWF679_005346 [Orbilia oligospora]|uniref:Uncharacterized protein n=1 Tax=Orbilia oligospora TaxID=2813651 RepID=A0A8H8VCJ6_ORBOL|nr:hypothetical protein TWF679_005346 [Orbilia oligospora]
MEYSSEARAGSMVHQPEPQSSAAEPSEPISDTTLIPFPGIRDGVQVFLGGFNGVEAYQVFSDYNLRTYLKATNKRHFLNLGALKGDINRLGLWFERVLRQPTSFWPLNQPRDLDLREYSRFFWDCGCGMEMSFQVDNMHFGFNNQSTETDMASLPTATKGCMAGPAKARPIPKRPNPPTTFGPPLSPISKRLLVLIFYTTFRYFVTSGRYHMTISASPMLPGYVWNCGPSDLCYHTYAGNSIKELYNRICMVVLCFLGLPSRHGCLQPRHPVDARRLKEDMPQHVPVFPFIFELLFLVADGLHISLAIFPILISFNKVLRGIWNLLADGADAISSVTGAGGSDDEVDYDSPNIDMAAECGSNAAASAGHQVTKTESRGQVPRNSRHARLRKKSRAAKEGNNSLPGSGAPSTNIATADPVPKPSTISDDFQIFFCARGSVGDRDILKVLKFSKSQNDRDLFLAFRKSYSDIRGWKLWFSFTHIHDIQYIKVSIHTDTLVYKGQFPLFLCYISLMIISTYNQFNRYSSKQVSRGDGLCHVDTTRQSLPDRQDRNYAIPHREPPVPIIRPMCRPEIMDHYDRPDDSINTSNCIKFAMPKRVNDLPAGRCDAWGLYAAEAICPTKILIWALIVNIVPIFVFAPSWLVNHPGDLQNAFVPSTVISVTYFGIVSAHMTARMGKRYNYE